MFTNLSRIIVHNAPKATSAIQCKESNAPTETTARQTSGSHIVIFKRYLKPTTTEQSMCKKHTKATSVKQPIFKEHAKATIAEQSMCEKHTKAKTPKKSDDMAKFKKDLKWAKQVVFITGGDISVESGIPILCCNKGYWRTFPVPLLSAPAVFNRDPSLVWEFNYFQREVAANARANAGHIAIANYEAKHGSTKQITVITQNVDSLHVKAGTKNLVELHGSLYKTRCTKCGEILVNTDCPICEALKKKDATDVSEIGAAIPVKSLPHCKKPSCGGLLKPYIISFSEHLTTKEQERAVIALSTCDVCMVVGSSSLVYPATFFPPMVAARGGVVAAFNSKPTPTTADFKYYFEGPIAKTIPEALTEL